MLKVNIENIALKSDNGYYSLLKKINFDLNAGKIYTILGKNGSGKSTLIKSLTNLLNKNLFSIEGTILFEGKDILVMNHIELLQIRLNRIRYVFQDAVNSFDPLKTFDYYFKNSFAGRKQIDELLEYFLLPGYDEISRLYPYEVSGGMAQRLSTILAFIAQPDLLILDEPTSGIDYTIANLLLLKLKEYVNEVNRSVLLVTQDINFAEKVSDEITFLHNRTLSAFENNKDFFAKTDNEQLIEFRKSYEELI